MRFRALAGGIAVIGAVLATALSGIAQADPSERGTTSAPLTEMRTAGDKGWFYTARADEAVTAEKAHGFTDATQVGRIDLAPTEGSNPVHRLRLKEGGPSYMLSISPEEWKSPKFVDEGVAGYLDGHEDSGDVGLVRFSKDGKWRVLTDTPANVENMKNAGYEVDGPLGWFRP
ncbi:hypothetical protein H7X46_21640 [Pseudonocardia sp. C8]|uniref:hypothetical protein n=1 Tax=Pseudonocardia sp. C8 TaxID=2762759 RepID=UPI0016433256|nr:hypothetical protein [Pseudonocardia sp. C8]MBC3193664.1 hypothetical protein [Pseudonocardia sp. C8]